MCAIIGAVLYGLHTEYEVNEANNILAHIWARSHERGRDGRGFVVVSDGAVRNSSGVSVERVRGGALPHCTPAIQGPCDRATVIGNLRAEPTTEYVLDKQPTDQQPYALRSWAIVHNGTIANDRSLRSYEYKSQIDSAAVIEVVEEDNPYTLYQFVASVKKIKGSFAILASNEQRPGELFVAANYRPVWYIETRIGTFFASARHYFPKGYVPQMLQPYSAALFDNRKWDRESQSLYRAAQGDNRALVVCSGGLDSVVAATYVKEKMGMVPHLIHFMYGCRAEGPEVKAVKAVAQHLGAELTLFPLNVYSKGDSPLLDPDSKVAGGEAGAEFAHEWVPARNLVLLSVATAFAEARGISTIVLGNNLEEAGAYPDNEPEFIARFNDLLPFAVGDGKRMQLIMPVGNLMKHEIVALGKEVNAPMHLTWSCYRAGEQHCGTCGPCFMRRTAFDINGFEEVITYKDQS